MCPFGGLVTPRSGARCRVGFAVLALALGGVPAGARAAAPPSASLYAAVPLVHLNVAIAEVDSGLARHILLPQLKDETGPFARPVGSWHGVLASMQELERKKQAKLFAQPRLVTFSGRPASFLDGGQQAVAVPDRLGQNRVQFHDFGTRVTFVPTVMSGNTIHLEVEPEVSSPAGEGGVRMTHRLHTTAELKPGQALLIGGLTRRVSGPGGEREVEIVVLVKPAVIGSGAGDWVR